MNGVAQHSSGYSGRISPVAFAKERPTSAFTSELSTCPAASPRPGAARTRARGSDVPCRGTSHGERRGGIHPIIEHQAVGYALADAKIAIEAVRYLSWRACHAVDMQSPAADELAIRAKIYGSETAVRVIIDLMRVVGIDSYDHEAPLGRPLQDALALPIFDGGNMGVRRRQLHKPLRLGDWQCLRAGKARRSRFRREGHRAQCGSSFPPHGASELPVGCRGQRLPTTRASTWISSIFAPWRLR